MKKTTKRLLSIVAALLMLSLLVLPGITGFPSQAAKKKYQEIELGQTIPLKKILDLPVDTSVPVAGFQFTIVPGTAKAATTAGYFDVKAGPVSGEFPKIANTIVFSPSDTKDTKTDPGATNGSSCTKTVQIEFTGVKFAEPGVYRYAISESAANGYNNVGVGYDENPYRILDIYVEDENGALKIAGTRMTKSATDDAESPANTTGGAYTAVKSDSFINKYPTNTLTVSKTVAGNQGSKDEYFKFTLQLIEDAVKIDNNLVFGIEGQDGRTDSSEITANAATTANYEIESVRTANNVTSLTGAQLKAGYDIYLQHGDTVTLSGLVENCQFSVTEANNKYDVATVTTKVGETPVNGTAVKVSGKLDKNTTIAYTNTKEGIIPTGILLSIAPWAIAGILLIGGIVFFMARSRSRYED